jgi:Family of unknown function (DUF6252)
MKEMKKVIVYTTLGLMAGLTLPACHKYTSIENGNGLPADMVASINGVSWAAADSTQTATLSQGQVTISGISADGGEISITLNDTVVGLYVLNQTSASLAVYANLDSVGSYAWSTNQGSDTAQAGGTVDVTAINAVNRTISGIFSFKAYRNSDGSQKDITAGVFYNIPYVGP